ncbi:unnamed protein product [Durusdinium trenchii]|uniref:U-box domain-containing protein n=4 Tax=Durusdinium trenchii TaxID=1381693 RepID=A0ABP0SLD1_9DINO
MLGAARPATPSETAATFKAMTGSPELSTPADFICPITQDIMEDPVVAADGVSYERYAIELWWRNGHHSSPLTNLPLEHAMLLPNQALRNLIQEHLSSWSLEQLDELQRRRQREQRRLHDANGSDAVSAVPRFASNFCISTQVMQDSHPAFLLLALSRRLL